MTPAFENTLYKRGAMPINQFQMAVDSVSVDNFLDQNLLNSSEWFTFMRTVSLPDFSGLPYSSEPSHLVRSSKSGWLQILRRMSMPAKAWRLPAKMASTSWLFSAQGALALTCMVDALEYPPIWIGKANCVVKTGSVPSLPGKTKSNSDHSSPTESLQKSAMTEKHQKHEVACDVEVDSSHSHFTPKGEATTHTALHTLLTYQSVCEAMWGRELGVRRPSSRVNAISVSWSLCGLSFSFRLDAVEAIFNSLDLPTDSPQSLFELVDLCIF
ncbi:MAG: hypothetical protein FRX49_09439 [Trebouxia sp. A1-2]|nr:MAG: hypothetical protein FRX49_09439 [Trebouxia sp. A1-2]